MFLFPPINTNYLKQNESVSTDLISFLSFLINDPHAYEQFKSMFQLDDHGNLIVRFKAPEEFELKNTENLQYNLDSQSREATFVFNQEQLNHIFTQNYGIETNCLALKVLLFIASHYELNGKIFENNNIETNLITAPKGFLNEIFNTYPFINFTTSEIYAVKKMLPELPLFIKLDMANDEYNDNHIVIIEISATDEAVLGKRLSDNQPIRYAFSDIEHLEYTAHLFPRNENEKLLMYFISRCDEWEVDNLINQPEIAQMLQLKIELDDSCTYKALQRILMACESKKIRENWSRLNHEQQVSFLNSLESGVKTRAEIFMQFYLQNPSLFEEESVPMEATIALLLQSIELQKLMGNHEDCFFESTNISEEALKGIAQKSLQTLTELAHFFARKGTLGVYEQFSNFLKLKSHNPKLALNLGIYSLEHSFELFGQLPEQIIEELNRHPKFERWFASVHMAADPQGMASQHWVDFKNFIINQEIVFTKQEPYAIASEAEYFIEQLRNLRYKDFPDATVSELVEGDKVSPVIIHAFQDKIKKIEDQARDAILNLIIKELQDLTFNFDECTSKLQLQAFRSKGSNRIFTIVYHPLCVQIAAREANNLSPKLEELHEVATQTYARLEQEYQKHLKPFEMKITAARQRQFNVARAQLNEELERLGGEAHNNLVSILSALDRVEKLVFAGEDVTLNQNLKMQALDDILYNSQNLDQNYPRMPVILRQLNRAVDLLAAEIHSADNVHEYSASGSGFGFFSQQHEARDSDVNASAEISDPIEPINKSI